MNKFRRQAAIGFVVGLFAAAATIAIINTPEAEAAPAAPLELLNTLPALNTGGDAVYAELAVSDDTGVVVTPNDAGVFTAIAGAPLFAGETDGSGCITASLTTGLFTIAKRCGQGEVELTACIARGAGSSNTAGTTTGAWVKNGTAVARTVAHRLVKVEAVDAGNAYDNIGCSITTLDLVLGDTVGFYLTNAGGGVTATVREGAFRAQKILNK